jgi:hypothetical protein
MKRSLSLAFAVMTVALFACTDSASAAEPYPFKVPPREAETEVWVKADFDSGLPELATLGKGAKLEPRLGTKNSQALVARGGGKASIIKIPIRKFDVGISRFELSIDYAGQGYTYFRAKLNAYNKQGKVFKSVTFPSGAYGYTPTMRTWEAQLVNLEFEKIYAVELELTQSEPLTNPPSTGERLLRIDNIELKRHDERVVYGNRARRDLMTAIKREGGEVTELGDLIIADFPKRQSFFDYSRIDEKKRFVRSQWQERLHIGTTYRESVGKLPTFVLGVTAKQATLDAAAKAQKKTLIQMYEYFLDDVASHGFNTVAVDFTKELGEFDSLAAARGISVILRAPSWNNLQTWIAKPTGPMPANFKTTATTKLAEYGKLKSLIGYHMDPPLNRNYEPMLAKAREYLASVNPKVQLVTQQSDIYAAENIAKPYPNFALQRTAYHHYIGRPWSQPSHMYHPNSWVRAMTEGHYRRILNAHRVRMIPTILEVPSGRQYGKKSINMQKDRVVVATTNWKYDDATKRWSGWYRYKYPPNLLRCIVWKAIQTGASGVIFDEWGPAAVAHDLKGSQILGDSKFATANYLPDLLRHADMSESDGWKELGRTAQELALFKHMLADSTLHGNNTPRVNNGNIRVSSLTGLNSPFKVLMAINTKVGDYAAGDLTIDAETGELGGYTPATGEQFTLTLKNDIGLIDFRTGKSIEPKTTKTKDRVATYELALGPGEGRFYFRGKQRVFRNFIKKYQIPISSQTTRASK